MKSEKEHKVTKAPYKCFQQNIQKNISVKFSEKITKTLFSIDCDNKKEKLKKKTSNNFLVFPEKQHTKSIISVHRFV